MKKILISLLSIIFIISMITNVYAATGSINSGASSDTVIKGKTFTVTLAATADSPIDGMYTKFDYNKDVLSLESGVADKNYGDNSGDNDILVVNNNGSTSPTSTTLYTMTFKVLDTTTAETAKITFSESELYLNTEGTMSKESAQIADVTINIKADDTTVGGGQEQTPSNGDNGNGGADNGSGSGSGTEEKKENVKQDTNSNKDTNKKKPTTKLPQTGAESTILIAIVALGAVSIVSYISYRKYNI